MRRPAQRGADAVRHLPARAGQGAGRRAGGRYHRVVCADSAGCGCGIPRRRAAGRQPGRAHAANPADRPRNRIGAAGRSARTARLALQAAADLGASFLDGVAFVPLAALSAAELLVPAIAGALGFTFQGPADPKAQLLAYLRTKDMLLVLDNFEHLLAGADVLSDLIQAAPSVVILATSRE